jgi:hypothetical protein
MILTNYPIDCTTADIEFNEQIWARAVRQKLGDPGRH